MELMRYERLRLATFLFYEKEWNTDLAIHAIDLVKQGYFFLDEKSIECVYCKGQVSDWKALMGKCQ